ncbi:sulfite reductase flavoprotein subunit alpha [Paraburkholderia sp. J41]|uniref:sulfite reductase subunit alpha n=1 Tax=Paraburkholderia sp. J41 TaxID=2805433 RepID=UPI002AC3401F|nr:sulfite reductase flavoprotein subunit alpha [Paraburkholderia sp. J41]
MKHGISRVAWLLAFASAALAWWCPQRTASAACVALAYGCACAAIVARHRQRGRASVSLHDGERILVAYASQTGTAEQLAAQSAAWLEANGARVRMASLGTLTLAELRAYTHALFIVSTTGEGEPPDAALPFVRRAMAASATLAPLRCGVLATGDRNYRQFCAFGKKLSGWLIECGAQLLFETIEVDNGDAHALRRWQTALSTLCEGGADTPWSAPRDSLWTLEARTLMNPGSTGAGAYHLVLSPRDRTALDWNAGDIAEIAPRHASCSIERWLAVRGLNGATKVKCDGTRMRFADALATRELDRDESITLAPQAWIERLAPLARRSYSIASLPRDGRLELLVRETLRHGEACGFGVASGWLTKHAQAGSEITLHVRTNRGFHAPADPRPLILVGNGTGLAGLRAHLKARAHAGHARNWLIFGERNAAHDAFWRDDIARWRAQGMIERVDHAWSRDGGLLRYVQDALLAAKATLREWIDDGAAIYVCGSRNGMASGVHQSLIDMLGAARVDALMSEGRYRRDVY